MLVGAGLVAEVQFISRDESLAGTLDNLSQKGIISAVILDELNEQRKSANIHFLHGTPRGEIQTGIADLPHWLRMHEEYNKYLIVSGKRTQSIRVSPTQIMSLFKSLIHFDQIFFENFCLQPTEKKQEMSRKN